MYYVVAIRCDPPISEDRIAGVQWLNSTSGLSRKSSTAQFIDWLEKGNHAYVAGHDGRAEIRVVRRAGGAPYLRTAADGSWTDNLRELPRY